MRRVGIAGLGLLWIGCAGSSNSDFFMPSTTGAPDTIGAGPGGHPSSGGDAGRAAGGAVGMGGIGGQSSTGAAGSHGGGAGTGPATATGGGEMTGSGGEAGTSGAGGMGGAEAGGGGTVGSGGIAGRSNGGGGAGGRLDAGAADARADAGNVRRIRCGNVTCLVPDQYCCIPDGSTPRCVSTIGGTCAANGNKILCDDRTDCPAENQICCAADIANGSSVADCRTLATCNGPKAQVLCDPQDPMSCVGSATNGQCSTAGSSTIGGYPHCQ